MAACRTKEDGVEEAGWRQRDVGLEAVRRRRGTEAGGGHEDEEAAQQKLEEPGRRGQLFPLRSNAGDQST